MIAFFSVKGTLDPTVCKTSEECAAEKVEFQLNRWTYTKNMLYNVIAKFMLSNTIFKGRSDSIMSPLSFLLSSCNGEWKSRTYENRSRMSRKYFSDSKKTAEVFYWTIFYILYTILYSDHTWAYCSVIKRSIQRQTELANDGKLLNGNLQTYFDENATLQCLATARNSNIIYH